MTNFYVDVIQRDPRYTAVDSCRDIALLEPTFRQAITNVINRARADGHELHVGETYRSRQRQQYLYSKGMTKLRSVGVHHYGLAVDLLLLVDGVYDADGPDYMFLRDYCTAERLIWGGDWGAPDQPHSFRDWDHVQRVGIKDQAALFAGAWYPDAGWHI